MNNKTRLILASIAVLIIGIIIGSNLPHPRSDEGKFGRPETDRGTSSSPNQPLKKTYDMGSFEKIILENGLSASITASTTNKTPAEISKMDLSSVTDGLYLIIVTGSPEDVNDIQIANNDHVLTVSNILQDKSLKRSSVKIEILAPELKDIKVSSITSASDSAITP